MAIKQLSNVAYIGNIFHVCLVHINGRALTESLQELQDTKDTQDISWHKPSAPKLIHNNVQYEIVKNSLKHENSSKVCYMSYKNNR